MGRRPRFPLAPHARVGDVILTGRVDPALGDWRLVLVVLVRIEGEGTAAHELCQRHLAAVLDVDLPRRRAVGIGQQDLQQPRIELEGQHLLEEVGPELGGREGLAEDALQERLQLTGRAVLGAARATPGAGHVLIPSWCHARV